jgi:O-antigen biosynthesis protein WbqV
MPQIPPQMPIWRRYTNVAALATHDIFMAAAAMEMAIWLRFAISPVPRPFFSIWEATVIFSVAAGVVFFAIGLHRGIWRYTAVANMWTILQAVTLTILIFVPALFLLTRLEMLPRSVIFIAWPMLVFFLSAPRITYRLWTSGGLQTAFAAGDANKVPILLVGAGDDADAFIRETQRGDNQAYTVVGIIVRDESQIGRDLRGVRVLGGLANIETVFDNLATLNRRPQRLVIAGDRLQGPHVRNLLDAADRLGVSLSRASRPTELKAGDPADQELDVRPIDVTDLLGRSQKVLDRVAMKQLVEGQKVLITGAGGTIGSELCRQIAALTPRHITLVDNGEFALYQIDLELAEENPAVNRDAILGDVRDSVQIDQIVRDAQPTIVFHAAAFKHVPLVEENKPEGVITNSGGTKNLADACIAHDVDTMVMISTDKAVNPSSIMGASKRIAELYCQAQGIAQTKTHFVTVRFGNVLGSTGSVVPLFQRQLARGGPLTVTHAKMTRYFMTAREAVELVLEAASLPPQISDEGRIFVLDMGDPVFIADIARQMIRLAGLRPDIDVQVEYTGLRPGEKLSETLFHEAEPLVPTNAAGVLIAEPRHIDLKILKPDFDQLITAAWDRNEGEVLRLIHRLVPEFDHESLSPQASQSSAPGE